MKVKDLTIGMCKKLGINIAAGDSVIIKGYENPVVLDLNTAYHTNNRAADCKTPVNLFTFRKPIDVKPNGNVPVYVKHENSLVDCMLAKSMPLSLEWKPAAMEIIDAIESGRIVIQ